MPIQEANQRLKELGIAYNRETGNFYGDPEAMNSPEGKKAMEERARLEKPREDGPVDNGPGTAYNGEEKRMIVSDRSREVNGPKDSKRWAQKYAEQYPEVMKDASKYAPVMKNVMEFSKNHPDIQDCTCDALTGEIVPPEKIPGYCVTFHQNFTEDDPYGGYTPEDYALMCAITKRELGTDSVYIGVYGNPEVSFPCKDLQKAMDFARIHNQETVYDPENDELIWNGEYDSKLNPINHGGGM